MAGVTKVAEDYSAFNNYADILRGLASQAPAQSQNMSPLVQMAQEQQQPLPMSRQPAARQPRFQRKVADAMPDPSSLIDNLFAPQAQDAEKLRQLAADYEGRQNPVDMKGLASIVDMWTGGNSAAHVTPTMTPEEKQLHVAKLRALAGQTDTDITKEKLGLLNNQNTNETKFATAMAKLEGMMAGGGGHKEDTFFNQTQQLLESARGNPAAAQAERDIYAATKAKSLMNLMGDPNNLSNQMVNLLHQELAKIATGGVPSQHELEGLDSGALKGKLAGVYQVFSNKPTPANAGAFLKQYDQYANALTGDAQKFIKDKYGRILESRRNRLGERNYGDFKQQYLDRFLNEAKEAPQQPAADAVTKKVSVSQASFDKAVSDIMKRDGVSQDAASKHLEKLGYGVGN